jgi:hypothetical protein
MVMQFPKHQLKESQILARLEQVFDSNLLLANAKATGFIKRKSKLNAFSFLQICLMSAGKACAKSLLETCTLLRERFGVRLRKQSLHERFTAEAVAFIKRSIEHLMCNQLFESKIDWVAFCRFRRILIGDCTCFALPVQFTASYKGPGGIYPGSAMKLYLEYDFLSATLACLKDDGWADQQTMSASGPAQIKLLIMQH